MATFTAHQFPGLANPVYLPDWIPVEIKIIPSSVPGWTSGQKVPPSHFTSTTWHDTGNPTSNANGEWSWANSGGRAEMSPPSPGSYNAIFDGTKIIICQRFDELVGHAANHTGNVTSYAFEQAGWGPKFSFDKSMDVGAWLHAGVLHAIGKTAKAAMYQHRYWSGKWCPGQILNRGIWSTVEDLVDEHIAEIAAFVSGGKPIPAPTAPVAIVRFEVPFRTSPGFWDMKNNTSNINRSRPTLPAGTRTTVIDGPREVGGITWYDLLLENGETGWVQDEILHTLAIS